MLKKGGKGKGICLQGCCMALGGDVTLVLEPCDPY